MNETKSTPPVQFPKANLTIPETGFLRKKVVLQFIPIGSTSWYEGIRKGIYPAPVKLSGRTSAWRCEDIRALITKLGGGEV